MSDEERGMSDEERIIMGTLDDLDTAYTNLYDCIDVLRDMGIVVTSMSTCFLEHRNGNRYPTVYFHVRHGLKTLAESSGKQIRHEAPREEEWLGRKYISHWCEEYWSREEEVKGDDDEEEDNAGY